MEPPKKMAKTEDIELKEMICSLQDSLFNKLQSIEVKIEKINSKYSTLEKKVNDIIDNMQDSSVADISCTDSSTVDAEEEEVDDPKAYTEEDFPDGSWLGDPDEPNFRVRCPIKPEDLEFANNNSTSAEKMALLLLDYLFTREEQACSNISGTGKHGKKQLDPIKILGIKYHVQHMFGTNEEGWRYIRRNLDSKCRTAFRRKSKGMPLTVKEKKPRLLHKIAKDNQNSNNRSTSRIPDNIVFEEVEETRVDEEIIPIEEESAENESITIFAFPSEADVPQADHEEIKVIHATREQFEILKQNPSVEFLQSVLSS